MKNYLLLIAIFLCASCVNSSQDTAKNWQWRGENRNGMYNETGLLKEWPEEGPQLLWYFEELGEGHTSVAITGEKLYATGMHGDDLVLYVFDLTGKLLTEKIIGKEWDTNWNGTRSSVCINDGKLYIFNALGTLFCLDEATLNEVWTKDLLTEFEGENLMFGMTESPLIAGNTIFMTPGGEQHSMVALNKETGELIWSSSGTGMVSSYCSPLYIADQSVPMVVTWLSPLAIEGASRDTWYDNELVAFNAETGEQLWSQTLPSQNRINPNTPIYIDGMILAVTGYKGGAWLYRLKDGGKTAELVWKNDEMDNQMGGAIKVGDYLYASGHTNNYWFCVDWKTGETKYKVEEIGRSNIIFAEGMLYCYSERGEMFLVKPNPEELEIVSSFKVTLGTAQHWAHPVIYQGMLYLRHGNALMAYKIK
ncbi:MAG: PQQ-like beta-propeller repeat protein [Bacteroidales bacterium]|nr:PQQ-like beta-propeller repeat protein [Bacteroidales bacterium]MCL2132782.1 PQQ-like beta-propeller repeat protein [Bacteroidales bacterium]